MKIKTLIMAMIALAIWSFGSMVQAAFIVESRSGGQNFAWYSDAGTWADSSSKSTAPGVTGGIGSRFSSNAFTGRSFTVAPDFGAGGLFEVFVTAAADMNANQPVSVVHAGGTDDILPDLSSGVANDWKSLGTWTFDPGFGGTVTLSSDGNGGNVIRADAVMFVEAIPEPGTLMMLGAGLLCLVVAARRRSA